MRLEAPIQGWEYRLLAWAHEPLQALALTQHVDTDDRILQAAYRYCEELTRFHSRTFYVASGLLPAGKRQAARALYAFCRVTDNLVDESRPGSDPLRALAEWREHVTMAHPPTHGPVALAWADTQARYAIPSGYAAQLIDGVGRDVSQSRYATFAELAEYSYGVASTVGLMAMHIVGFTSAKAVPYAVKLGVALQLTNILRDVAEDWRAGRLYLPQDELDAFGISNAEFENGVVTERWRDFMRFQIERNRQLYAESREGIALLNADGRFAIAAAADLYCAILDDIEENDYDVFSRRARVSSWGKVRRLPNIWWQSRRVAIA
ncbi:MAG: squalene/phytoene synthase family protein [Anaerolineae bacterium]|nr:squalene/phytoene synthase family protein [Anaerolineae bacterium]